MTNLAMPDLATRLWVYQAERFPLGKTATLVAVFSAAGLMASARLAHRTEPGWPSFAVAFAAVLIVFYQMRACDELKDRADDARHRPERPVPRGLVTLREVMGLALGLVPLALGSALWLSPAAAGTLLLVWAWLGLMTAEFGAPAFLRRRPVLYLAGHMLIMPLIDLFVTACEWGARGAGPPSALWPFIAMSFANGCALELGRKIWAPANERPGVETYSRLWGPRRALLAWGAAIAAALALAGLVVATEGAPLWISAVAAVAAAGCASVAHAFLRDPTPAAQRWIDGATGAWVFTCYVCVGFLPALGGAP